MFSMHSAVSTIDDEPIDPDYLFQQSSHQHDLLAIPLTGTQTDADLHMTDAGEVPLSAFEEQYHESHPTSAPFSDFVGVANSEDIQMSHEDDGPEPGASIKAEFADEQRDESTSSKAWRLDISSSSQGDTAKTTATPSQNNDSSASISRAMPKKSKSQQLKVTANSSSQSESSMMNGSARQASTISSGRESQGPLGAGTPDTPLSVEASVPGSSARKQPMSVSKKLYSEVRPRSSIPSGLTSKEFGAQCVLSAYSSRLDPFGLHRGEYELLKDHITFPEVTVYLNIRNAILRQWTRAPQLCLSRREALGCAKDTRFFPLADVAFSWLQRNGYINFGCLEIPNSAGPLRRFKSKTSRQRTIVVIGAGVSGLGCARQLESLALQLGHRFTENGEKPPKILVLEGRGRVGGRVYSHPLKNQGSSTLPQRLRSTAEMGAQIITGFEHGNPLNIIARGQLGIHYHRMRDNTILYDYDGQIVERDRDVLVEGLYNDILERVSTYRNKPATIKTIKVPETMVWYSRDPPKEGDLMISALDESEEVVETTGTGRQGKKKAGRAYQLKPGQDASKPAAEAAKAMGWQLKVGVAESAALSLDPYVQAIQHPTLGHTMDEGIRQYQNIIEMSSRDLRLLNWHHANLEYANAVTVNDLSLGGWDQDIGNEFEGFHSEVIGGYTQVPRGLWKCPTPLDVRFNHVVEAIRYSPTDTVFDDQTPLAQVECRNGEIIQADAVIVTTPLGVLKEKTVKFEPELPVWKLGAIERLGFGLLNKVILVFNEPFWEEDRDMFGLLNDAAVSNSLNQEDYFSGRGHAYLFWNCIKISGRPVLSALMAGHAAQTVEKTDDKTLVREVMDRLKRMFFPRDVPDPVESIVTRWKKDPFARGSYSYVAPTSVPGDYEAMAKQHGQLFFAGEATNGLHPATVHGAYLSGLRAASDVVEKLLGPIHVPTPLVQRVTRPELFPSLPHTKGIKRAYSDIETPIAPAILPESNAEDGSSISKDEHEAAIQSMILSTIGERPKKQKQEDSKNPWQLFERAHYDRVKEETIRTYGKIKGKNPAYEVKKIIGKLWAAASEEEKKPFKEAASKAQAEYKKYTADLKEKTAAWEQEAARIRQEYIVNNSVAAGSVGRSQ